MKRDTSRTACRALRKTQSGCEHLVTLGVLSHFTRLSRFPSTTLHERRETAVR